MAINRKNGITWSVLFLWWFLVYEDGITVRWGSFQSKAECQVLLEKVARARHTSGCLTEPALSKEYRGPLAGQTA
jgi:hypothetical protein